MNPLDKTVDSVSNSAMYGCNEARQKRREVHDEARRMPFFGFPGAAGLDRGSFTPPVRRAADVYAPEAGARGSSKPTPLLV